MRKGSVMGLTLAATKTSASRLATAGRTNQLRLGSTRSMRPEPSFSRLQSTRSPTRGEVPSSRKRPRALHTRGPWAVCTV